MTSRLRLSLALIAASSLILLSSCATNRFAEDDPSLQRDLDTENTFVSESGFSWWVDKPGNGPLRVSIDLSDQAAYIYRGDVQIGRSRVATGKAGNRTPSGSFRIQEKIVDKRSNLYGKIYGADGRLVRAEADTRKHSVPSGGKYVGAAMPYWMRLTGYGIGMHVGPIPNPGSPASHGCIRMPRDMAMRLFENAEVGTRVRIRR